MSQRSMPDHALDAEESVLGACLAAPEQMHAVSFLRPEHFFSPSHGMIYEAMLGIDAEGAGLPDATTLANWLRVRGKLDLVQSGNARGIPALAHLLNAFPSVANIEHYARIVFEAWQVRQLEQTALEIAASCRGVTGQRRELLDRSERRMCAVTGGSTQQNTGAMFGEAIRSRFTDLKDRADAMAAGIRIAAGQPTGFTRLDDMTGGMTSGDMWVLAARPGYGKTSLALNIAINVAYGTPQVASDGSWNGQDYDVPPAGVVFFSLEMPKAQIVDRALCAEAKVDTQNLKQGRVWPEDWKRLTEATGMLGQIPLWIDDAKGLSTADIRGRAQRQKDQWAHGNIPLGLVVIDYLQLVRGGGVKGQNREQEVAAISKEIKAMAGILGCPVLALAQLTRTTEKEQRRPRPSDIRDSGQVEQDADWIGFLCRDKETPEGTVDLFVSKQRNGSLGCIHLGWLPQFTRFENYSE